MKKVSVIVPAYNAHSTLARCLGSLVNQTLRDIEIIVVNDASTDDTYEIMKRCRDQFPDMVRIIDGEVNRGSGGARNQGFDAATGEYIGLVDSDDIVTANMYELLYRKAKEGDYDIVDSGFYKESTDEALIYTGDNVTGELDDDKRNILISCGGYLWTKIFKRELFNDPVIRMREKVRCLEDSEILTYMFLRAKSIGNVKEIFYKYCDMEGSATKQLDLDVYLDSIEGAMKATWEVCRNLPTFEGARASVEYAISALYSYGINRCLYDRIAEYGASEKNVARYFEKLPAREQERLKKLAGLKKMSVFTPYSENPITADKIGAIDTAIMKECDRRFGGC